MPLLPQQWRLLRGAMALAIPWASEEPKEEGQSQFLRELQDGGLRPRAVLSSSATTWALATKQEHFRFREPPQDAQPRPETKPENDPIAPPLASPPLALLRHPQCVRVQQTAPSSALTRPQPSFPSFLQKRRFLPAQPLRQRRAYIHTPQPRRTARLEPVTPHESLQTRTNDPCLLAATNRPQHVTNQAPIEGR